METITHTIPDELKRLCRWLVVEKHSKIPSCAHNGKNASVTNPDTWSDYKTAVSIAQKVGGYLGFVFDDDGYIGIDIDHAITQDGLPSQAAIDAISLCKSYTELSKSSTGFHIIVKGKLARSGYVNHAGWEIYSSKRYFVLTGNTTLFNTISSNQAAIDELLTRHFSDCAAPTSNSNPKCIYNVTYTIQDNLIKPLYPTISSGSRHLSLVSLSGQLKSALLAKDAIYKALSQANQQFMRPPLSEKEVLSIYHSTQRKEHHE